MKYAEINKANFFKLKKYSDERFNMDGLTERESLIKHFVYDTRKGKYISIIKYLDSLKSRIEQNVQENYFPGVFRNLSNSVDCRVKFNNNLNGLVEFLARSREGIQLLDNNNLEFVSNINPLNGNYRIKFKPLLHEIEFRMGGKENQEGKFITMMVEIKD